MDRVDIHSVAKSEEQTRLENIIIIIVALAVEYELIDAAVTFFYFILRYS